MKKKQSLITNNNQLVLNGIAQQLDKLKEQFKLINQYHEANELISQISATLQECEVAIKESQKHVEMAETDQPTDMIKLLDAFAQINPLRLLWSQAKNFDQVKQNWIQQSINQLDAKQIEKETNVMLQETKQLAANLQDYPIPYTVVIQLFQAIKSFQTHLPLVSFFNNHILKQQHLDEMSELLGITVEQSLGSVMELGLQKHYKHLEAVLESAQKEYSLEKTLDYMEKFMKNTQIEIKQWKDEDTYILGEVTTLMNLVEEQRVTISTMRGSPYGKKFKNRIVEWDELLQYIKQLFDLCPKVQAQWMYLEPVLTILNITLSLELNEMNFNEADSIWKAVMNHIKCHQYVIDCVTDKELVNQLRNCYGLLEKASVELKQKIQLKRTKVAEYENMTDDEILYILSKE